MRKINKIIAVLMIALMGVGFLVGCGPDSPRKQEEIGEDLSGSLTIRVWSGGYGIGWLENIVESFNERYPNVTIDINSSVERQQVFGEIIGETTEYDLVFSESILYDYTDYILPLDEVYEFVNEGETKKVSEKIDGFSLEMSKNRGHYYVVPCYNGVYGIVYNCDYISENSLPVTTDELKETCKSLKGSIPSIIFSGEIGTSYWNFIYNTWLAQYEGKDSFIAAQKGMIIEPDGNLKIDPSSAWLLGELKAMQVCEDLLWYENGYIKKDSTGLQFINAQREFLKGEAAMMYNGSWMMNEMKRQFPNGTDSEFKMMRVPIISSIIEKCPSIENDAELSSLIKAIDSGKTELSGDGYDVVQSDFDRVREARGFYYAGGEAATGVIPIKAMNKELAKRFLAYMYSDKGIQAHAASNTGCALPVKSGSIKVLENTSSFLKSCYDIQFNSSLFFMSPQMAVTQYCTDASLGMIEKQFGSQKAKDRVRAIDSYNSKKTSWSANDNEKFWNELISNGIIDKRP